MPEASGKAMDNRKNILVICGDYWHPAEIIREGFASLENEYRHFIFMEDPEKSLTEEVLSQYQVVVNCRSDNTNVKTGELWFSGEAASAPKLLRGFVEAGGNFLVIHAGCSFSEKLLPEKETNEAVKEYIDLAGCRFLRHPPQCDVEVSVVNPEHPVMRDVEDFTADDEHYLLEMTAEFYSPLFETSSEEGGQGMIGGYTRMVGSGRVIVMTPGHTRDVWENEQFRRMLSNALNYCFYGEEFSEWH